MRDSGGGRIINISSLGGRLAFPFGVYIAPPNLPWKDLAMRYAWNWPHLTLKLASLNQVQSAPIFYRRCPSSGRNCSRTRKYTYRVAFES